MTRAASVIHSTWVSHFATAQGAMQIKSMQMISMQMSCMQTSRSLPSGIFHRVFFGLYGFFQLFSFLFFSSFFGRPPRQKKRKKYKKKKSFQNEIQLNGLDSGRDLERSSGLGTKISNNKKKTEKPIKRIPSRPVSDWNSREKAENSLPVSVVFFCSTEWTLLQKNPVKSVKTR